MGRDGVPERAQPTVAELADWLPIGLFVTDADGLCAWVNEPWCQLSGLTRQQAMGRGWSDAVHVDDASSVGRAWDRFVAGEDRRLVMELRVGDPAHPTWVRVLGRAQREPDGTLRRCVGTVTELTDQGAQTQMLLQLVDRISDIIIVLDDSGTIRWVNEQAERFLGRPRAECFGLSVLGLIHPEDQAAAAERLTAANEAAAAGTARDVVPAPQHLRALAAGGVYRQVECVATNLLDEPSVRGIVIVGRDLTEREHLERRVHELERAFTTAFRYSPVGRAIVALDGRWLQLNEAFTTMLGRDAEDLIGTAGIDAVHPDDRKHARTQLSKLVDRTTDRVTLDVRFLRPDGGFVWTRFTVWHVLDPDGEPLYYAADVTDVTEVRAAREAEERAHRQLRFLLERSADAVLVLDADAQITYISPASEHVFGRTVDALLGQPVAGVVHPEDLGAVTAKLQSVLRTPGATEVVTARVLHEDGQYRWVEGIGRNLLDDPDMPGIVINVRDVTERVEADTTLRQTQARFEALVEHASDLIIVNDQDGTLTYASPSAETVLGFKPSELVGHSARDLVHPDDIDRFQQEAQRQFERGVAEPILYRARHRDGTWHDLESIVTDLSEEPAVQGTVTNSRDVTERRAAESRANDLVEILEATSELVIVSDAAGRIVYVNRSARALLGAYEGQHVTDLSSDATLERLRTDIMPTARHRGSWTGELELIDASGGVIPVATTVQVLRDDHGQVTRIATVAHDITELKAAQRRLEFEATHDSLTGLPNRALFREISERAIARAGRTDEDLAVLFLDLDGFKLVNDSYGHDVGDLLLGMVARRLRDTVRAGDTLARLGGDEFVILCEHPRGEVAMLELSERIIEKVSQPSKIEGYQVRVGLSIGIAFSRGAEKGVVELIRDADVALYRAKHQGRGRAEVYDDSAARTS
ncbi:MAG TPA: PAS domain S-box protein [Acidimicrobiia bacterium]|nr:PAS domain S-box protein [Acidimicrobiia bacterium]